MQLRYNYRLDPGRGQRAAWRGRSAAPGSCSTTGCAPGRKRAPAGLPYVTDAELSARLTAAKASPERAWLGEVSAVVLQQALADLDTAYRNFFASVTGQTQGAEGARHRGSGPVRIAGRRSGSPRNARLQITAGGKLRLPKIGDVPVRWSRALPSATVQRHRDQGRGRAGTSPGSSWQAGDDPLPQTGTEVGIDLGLTHFAVLSDGRKVA